MYYDQETRDAFRSLAYGPPIKLTKKHVLFYNKILNYTVKTTKTFSVQYSISIIVVYRKNLCRPGIFIELILCAMQELPSRQATSNQRWFNAGPPSTTLVQRHSKIDSTSRIRHAPTFENIENRSGKTQDHDPKRLHLLKMNKHTKWILKKITWFLRTRYLASFCYK